MEDSGMMLLAGLRVVQIGAGMAAAVCGRLLADIGADVACVDADNSTALANYLNQGKAVISGDPAAVCEAFATADLIVCEGQPRDLRTRHHDAKSLRRLNARAALVLISPFRQSGPQAEDPATD